MLVMGLAYVRYYRLFTLVTEENLYVVSKCTMGINTRALLCHSSRILSSDIRNRTYFTYSYPDIPS